MIISALLLLASTSLPIGCRSTQDTYATLKNQFHEDRVMVGIAAGGGTFETWANIASGTWTTMITQTDGVTCIVSTGSSFRAMMPGEDV